MHEPRTPYDTPARCKIWFIQKSDCLCGPSFRAGSPWPKEEEAVARSCPWAKPPDVAAALESTGGRGEDAIELLIAARNEPSLAEDLGEDGGGATNDEKRVGNLDDKNGGKSVRDESPPGPGASQGAAAGKGGKACGDAAGVAPGNGKKRGKAAQKTARAADCPCGSGQKYKKCCRKKDAAIARGQTAAPPAEPQSTPGDSTLVDDLGSLMI